MPSSTLACGGIRAAWHPWTTWCHPVLGRNLHFMPMKPPSVGTIDELPMAVSS